jgi:hypothetical protein
MACVLRIAYAMSRALKKFLYLGTFCLGLDLVVKCACLRLLHLSHNANVVGSRAVLGKSKWPSCPKRILVCLLQLQVHMSASSSTVPGMAWSCHHWCCLLARLKQRHALFFKFMQLLVFRNWDRLGFQLAQFCIWWFICGSWASVRVWFKEFHTIGTEVECERKATPM